MKTITEKLSDLGYKNKKMYHLHESPHGEKKRKMQRQYLYRDMAYIFPKLIKKKTRHTEEIGDYVFISMHICYMNKNLYESYSH